MTISRLLAPAVLTLATTLTMSACSSSNETPTKDPTPSQSSPSSESEPSTPTVPAGYQTANLGDVAEISVPADWTLKSSTDALDTLEAPKNEVGFPPGFGTAAVSNLAGGDPVDELEQSAKYSMEKSYAGYKNLKRLPDETINGTDFYRLQFESETTWFDVYGTVTPDAEYSIVINWQADKLINRQEAEAIWSPVMPTFKML